MIWPSGDWYSLQKCYCTSLSAIGRLWVRIQKQNRRLYTIEIAYSVGLRLVRRVFVCVYVCGGWVWGLGWCGGRNTQRRRDHTSPQHFILAKECKSLENITHGNYSVEEGSRPVFEDTIQFKCQSGFRIHLGDIHVDTFNRTCLANRTWSGPEPQCQGQFCDITRCCNTRIHFLSLRE